MFKIEAITAGLQRVADEGSSVPETAQYCPYYIFLNVFTASKASTFIFYFSYISFHVFQN